MTIAIEVIERYEVKTDKASGIVNDPNDWCGERDDPTCIEDLIKKGTTVTVESTKIVDSLPQWDATMTRTLSFETCRPSVP